MAPGFWSRSSRWFVCGVWGDAGEQETIDVTRLNPSWISTVGDMISTTQDLHTSISALLGGMLLPAQLLAEMWTWHPTGISNIDYGLGVFVLNTDSGGIVISHNGAAVGTPHDLVCVANPGHHNTALRRASRRPVLCGRLGRVGN
jgi:D-alanyl-D-alanine carboxypeptidase